jgi:hypothetical protein
MSKLHDFLLEHAKFPFPHPDEGRSAGTTDISGIEVELLEGEWKANPEFSPKYKSMGVA